MTTLDIIEATTKAFKRATDTIRLTNQILEPLNLPIGQRQLENDRVDILIKRFMADREKEIVAGIEGMEKNHEKEGTNVNHDDEEIYCCLDCYEDKIHNTALKEIATKITNNEI